MTFGHSDLRGRFSVELAQGHRTVDLDLSSRNLRLADVGLRAAGRATGPNPPWLLSDARLSLNVLRIGKATVKYRAEQVQVGRLALQEVSARASRDGGVLTVAPLTAAILGGRADGQLMLDARKDVPAATVDLGITDLQLGRFPYKAAGPAPLEGPLRVRVDVKGTGLSVHQVAASATGTVTAQVRAGRIRESLAELTGLDLRGLGLLLTGSTTETPMRCAVASFKAHDGTLVAQRLVADTDPVLITGEGLIHMDSETLDLKIHGTPKGTRLLRLRAPVLIQGTLGQPSVHIQEADSKLVLVDPGRARDADCSTLLDGAHS